MSGIRISGRPEQRVGLGIVGAGQPRRAAALFEIDVALPRFGAGLASRGNRPEAPGLLAGVDAVRGKESANAFVAARHAGDDEIADDERRHGAAVGLLRVFRQHDFPEQRAIHAADGNEVRVVCDEKDARAEHRHTAIETDRRIAAKARASAAARSARSHGPSSRRSPTPDWSR